MTKSLLVYSGNDPQYLAIAWHVLQTASDAGQDVVLLDLSGILPGVGDAYNRRLLRFSGGFAPDARFRALVTSEGVRVIDAGERVATVPLHLVPQSAADGIAESVHSALVSYARDPLPATGNRLGTWARLQRALATSASATFQVVVDVLDGDDAIDRVYVANGRFPHQRATIEAAFLSGRSVVYYEKGEQPDSFWLENHSTLDRFATQGSVDEVLQELSAEEAVKVGRGWMNGRARPGSATNIYSRFFSAEGNAASAPSRQRKVIGLFTSSQDEFAALGPEWHVQEWADQWEAFDHVLSHLGTTEFDFYLRVHPNFTTKSHASFVRERENVLELQRKHPALSIIWHDEQVNSYSLIGETNVVIVWDSTIGLEASGRGVPVWELAASYYDLYADVRQWFGRSQDPRPGDLEYAVDVVRAHRFMAYLVLRDSPLPDSVREIRRQLTPTPGWTLRAASVAASGGAPNPAIALASIVDAGRHRRFAINRLAAQKLVQTAGK